MHAAGPGCCLAGVVLLLTSSLPLILLNTWCERYEQGVCGQFGLERLGVTKIALGRLELHLA
eukprot:1155665-Pelagomonas_calceolata.AAC.5